MRQFLCSLMMVAVTAAFAACQKPENAAAKERVFSPPPPNPAQVRAQEKLDVSRLPTDETTRKRVVGMMFPEVHARANGGVFNVKETMTLQRGESSVVVNEAGSIRFNPHGDLAVDLSTGTTERMQLIYSNEVMYTKNRAGSWRVSRDPAEERWFWADNTFASLRTTLGMLKDNVEWTAAGQEKVDGRNATRFTLKLKTAPTTAPAEESVDGGTTTVTVPDGGALFQAAQQRRRAVKGSTPESVEGTLWVDEKTAVPVKVDLMVVMKLPPPKKGEAQRMTLTVQSELTHFGVDEEIRAPAEAVEEIIRKRVPPNPLEWMDAGGRAAAKTPVPGTKTTGPAKPEEPPEDEE